MQGWQMMDQATLDDAYANAPYIPDAEAFPPRWQAEAADFRAKTRCDLDIAYAATNGATLDLFHPEGQPGGLVVFVHGGYWRRFGKSDWSHFAAGALAAGQAVAMIGYPLAPNVRIHEITTLVSRGIDAAATRISGPIRLTGHSAGGHLVARMLQPDAAPACVGRIATCVPISPVADLRPLVPQSLNVDWNLTPEEADRESPCLHPAPEGVSVAIHVGAAERPSFLWQAEALAEAWSAPVRRAEGRHHFDVIDALKDPASRLMCDLLGR